MSKKYITDSILTNDPENVSVVSGAIGAIVTELLTQQPELAETGLPIHSNIPDITTDANGEDTINWQLVLDGDSYGFAVEPHAAPQFTKSTIVAIATWHDETAGLIAQPTGAPFRKLKSLYILALPSIDKMRTENKLRAYVDSLFTRDMVAVGRKIARKMDGEADSFTLINDPVGQFLAATTTGSREAAFNRMFTYLQAYMMNSAAKTVEALKARGDHANARVVQTTYSRTRLSKPTLMACLSSQEAAERFFPNMVNTNPERGSRGVQWENILRRLIARAPNHKVKKLVKAEGEPVLDEAGNKTYETVPVPQSPAIFAYWLETRNEVQTEMPEEIVIDFDMGDDA